MPGSPLGPHDAVLLTFHGTVERLDDVPEFLRNIRRGRPAPEALVAEIRHRLEHIGGSPLNRVTSEQAALLEARLGVPVRMAARLFHPYAREVLPGLAAAGTRRVLSLPIAPQSTAVYHAALRAELEALAPSLPHPIELVCAPPWGAEPALLEACAETVREGLARLDAPPREVSVVLSAHSLPLRVLAAGDAYERELRAMAEGVAALVRPLVRDVRVAFQSQGATDDAWLGPSLEDTFRAIVAEGGAAALVAPIGFQAEHVETLYDLDVDAPRFAREAGLARFARAPALGTRPRFIDALEAVARRALEGAPRAPS